MRARCRRASRGGWRRLSRRRRDRTEIQAPVAPLQHLHRIELVRLEALHEVGAERLDIAGHAERAIVHVPAGAASDLAELTRRQATVMMAIELAHRSKSDVVDVEIEPHADRIGGHEIFHITILVERDLGVARAWR